MSATDRLDQIEARTNAATKGPWTYGGKNRIETPVIEVDEADWGGEGLSGYAIHAQQDTGAWRYADAEFMAAARADVPWLIEQVRKRDAALLAVLELHRETVEWEAEDSGCYFSGCAQECTDAEGFSDYPCPTVRAIEEALS